MKRKLVGGAILIAVALAAVWLFWLRGRGDGKAGGGEGGAARSGAVTGAGGPAGGSARSGEVPRDAQVRWVLDADREGAARLEGQVLGPDGKGVGGAEVWLSSVPPRRATSEDDGSFAFDKLAPRTYRLSARSGALIGGPVTYKLSAKSDPVVIRVGEGASVVVTVLDEAQRPIAGAEVRGSELAERAAARTDAKGEATLAPVHPGYVSVTAAAAGHAPGGGFAMIGSPGAVGRTTITLRKGYPVSGRVVDEAGKPIARAKVAVRGGWWTGDGDAAAEAEPAGDGPPRRRSAITDDQGQFAIPAVASGTHRLAAIDGAHAPATSDAITVSDAPVTGVVISMKAGGVLVGRVTDAAGAAVPNATVRVGGAGRSAWVVERRQATTDAQGAFEVRGLPREKVAARAESEDAASALTEVDLTAQAKGEVKLVLDVSGVIAGKVVDDRGAAVPEIQVTAFPDLTGDGWEGFALAGMTTAITNGAGEFTIHGLPEGSYKLLAARAVRTYDWGRQGTPAKTGDRGVVVKLPAPGGVKGTLVVAGTTDAPTHALVQVGALPPTPAHGGAFEVRDVAPGAYDVVIRGAEFAELVQRNVKIEPGKTADMGQLVVQRGRRLSGKVVDGDGRPIAGAKVRVGEMLFTVEDEDDASGMEDLTGIRSAISGADGGFAIAGLSPKATNAGAEHPAHGRSNPLPIPEGAQDPAPIVLALRGFGSIAGKVMLKGAPQANVTITSSQGGGAQMAFARTDERGTFSLAKVAEGTHVLQAMMAAGPGTHRSTSATVTVVAGKEAQVTIDIPVGQVTLAVLPKALAGQKIDSAQVFLLTGQQSPANGKQIGEIFMQGGAVGSKIWFGGKPAIEFAELVPGDYSICTLPINGDLNDPTFAQRLMRDSALLKVYCKPQKVAAAPPKLSLVHEVPAMTPLPEN